MDDLSTNLTLPYEYEDGDHTSSETGETYLHLLAKQNNVKELKEYIQQIQNLEDGDEKSGLEKDMTNGMLMQVSNTLPAEVVNKLKFPLHMDYLVLL